MRRWISLVVLVSLSSSVVAQDVPEVDLENFLKAQLEIASKIGTTAREAPGVVTLITREDITASGARDLIDVLRLVPGFDFAVDVQGVVGPAIRGNWAHEGKVLLLIDGIEMNEPLFSTLQFGNHFPVAHIERIEIIRGPGSVIYGGFAELAVISIITRSGSDLKSGFATLTEGEMSDTFARRRLDFGFGWTSGMTNVSILGGLAAGNRSDRTYTDLAGSSYSMKDASKLGGQHLNLSLDVQNWRTRVLLDRYLTTQRDEFIESLPEAVDVDFLSWFLDSTYTWQVSNELLMTPRVMYKRQTPWRERHADYTYDKTVDRYGGGVTAIYERTKDSSFMAGLEYTRDRAETAFDPDGEGYFPHDKRQIEYDNVAFFSQARKQIGSGTITLGGRYERHSQFGSSFVPRLAFTTLRGRFHFKALASRAFRTPSIENIRLNEEIRPERTTVFEVESGYQLSDASLLTANAYQTAIRHPIVYLVDSVTFEEGYVNFDRTGSRGFDVEYRLQVPRGVFTAAYSYAVAHDNEVELYEVPANDHAVLGLANHKFILTSSIDLSGIRVSPTLVHYGHRHGYSSTDAEGERVLEKFDAATFINVSLTKSGLFGDRVDVGVGVFNLLDEDYRFIQPYNSGHAPLPDTSREFLLRVTTRFGR